MAQVGYQVAPQDETELNQPRIVESSKKDLQSIVQSTKWLFDSKHTFCYLIFALLTTVAASVFLYLYTHSPINALSQFIYDSEQQKNPAGFVVQLEVTQLTWYHSDIIKILVCFICLLVLSASLFTMGLRHCNKPAGKLTLVLTILFLLLLTALTFLTSFEIIRLLLNNEISTEITTMLQAGTDSALLSLQDRNRCCKIIMSTKLQSLSNTICRHETNVPNCTEMFTNIISFQHKILGLTLTFIILPILCLFCYNFVYPIFKKCLSPTTIGNEHRTEEEEELNAAANQIPLQHQQQTMVDSRTVQLQFPSYNAEVATDLLHHAKTPTEPIINITEINIENNRGTELSSNTIDRSKHTFPSDNSELLRRRKAAERDRERDFNSAPSWAQDKKESEEIEMKLHSK